MASENFLRVIPMGSDPWVAIINGIKYSYPAGTEQEVPAEVAVLIDAQERHEQPKYPPVQGGGDMLVTITVIMPADAEAQPEFLADKTFAEIESAVDHGRNVRVKINANGADAYIPLTNHVPGMFLIFSSYDAGVSAQISPDGAIAEMLR